MLTLLGVGVVVLGFLLRFNPLLVIAAAVFVTGWAGHISLVHTVAALGHAFNQSRLVSVAFLVLPVIGLLERAGLQEQARMAISKIRAATAGRLLLVYLFLRQISIAFGLQINGQAAMVRPLIAPMAEAAADTHGGPLDEKTHLLIRAYAAATDNVGAFFGEDIFVAIGSILLIKGMLDQAGFPVQPLALSLWAIPTAILAFVIHGARLLLLDRRLAREARK
ncbi:MAG TPA: DUF969 domain-containing protein [Rhizomicrobium sp.]|nr:DUF969 domain-containing protein [Rhizomicrobium sp.]